MIKAYFQEDGGRTIVFLNPHSDAVLHVERLAADEFDFFGFVLNGHKYLWLPPAVGCYVVGYGILVFVIVLVTGVAFRLPTAAEWEYACRAGTSTRLNNGTDSAIDALGWHAGNAKNHPRCVGLKLPNSWGLYDMHGNVFEWCSDASGSNHVLFGGSFLHHVSGCASSYRAATTAGTEITGFRLVCPCEVPSFCY